MCRILPTRISRLSLLISVLAASAAMGSAAYAGGFALPSADRLHATLVQPVAQKALGATGAVGQGKVVTPGGGGVVVYATTDLKCGDTVYRVTTGMDKGGKCTGKGASRTCTDGGGNSASATCKGGCGDTSGAGACTIMSR